MPTEQTCGSLQGPSLCVTNPRCSCSSGEPVALGGTLLRPAFLFSWRPPRSFSPLPAFTLLSTLFGFVRAFALSGFQQTPGNAVVWVCSSARPPAWRDHIPERGAGREDDPWPLFCQHLRRQEQERSQNQKCQF